MNVVTFAVDSPKKKSACLALIPSVLKKHNLAFLMELMVMNIALLVTLMFSNKNLVLNLSAITSSTLTASREFLT